MPSTSGDLGAPRDGKVDVLGIEVSAVDPARTLATISGWISRKEAHYICVTGVHGIMESVRDDELRRIHNDSGLTVPDGMPLVWASHFAGAPWVKRVYGPDLVLAVAAKAASVGWRCAFYGGADGVADDLALRLSQLYPGLRIALTISPPFRAMTTVEDDEAVRKLNDAMADVIFVGLSTPKQEKWMAEHREILRAPVLIGVGAAFDFHTGRVRQAPAWMQSHGLEWIFRLIVEPRRLWRRYFRNNPAFVLAVLRRRPKLLS